MVRSWIVYTVALIVAVTGLLFCTHCHANGLCLNLKNPMEESFEATPGGSSLHPCPTALVRQGNQFVLFQDEHMLARFESLQEYVDYMDNQLRALDEQNIQPRNAQGVPIPVTQCPVLFFEETYAPGGKPVYRKLPDPYDLQNRPQNAPQNAPQEAKAFNPNDVLHSLAGRAAVLRPNEYPIQLNAGNPISHNPMDTNWGGVIYSQQAIDSGVYDRRTVGRPRDVDASSTLSMPSV